MPRVCKRLSGCSLIQKRRRFGYFPVKISTLIINPYRLYQPFETASSNFLYHFKHLFMTSKTFSALLILALTWSACGSDAPQTSEPTSETAPAPATPSTTDFGSASAAPSGDVPALVSSPGAAVAPQPAAAPQTATPAGAAGKVNPPHGQPGHVCGTPVGAALDGSAPKTAAQPSKPTTAKPVTVPAPTGASTATVAPGTNPPHGQPGHVCGTPVGSPLPKQ